MTTLQKCLSLIAQGKGIRISFLERRVFINGKPIQEPDYSDIPRFKHVRDCLEYIEKLYAEYRTSRPSERDNLLSISSYFEALPYGELSPTDLLGEARDIARIRLEVTVLGLIINGSLWWDKTIFSGWRYASPTGLTLKRSWIQPLLSSVPNREI